MAMYHEGNRALQDAFGSRPLADRLVERLNRSAFTEADAAFIASPRGQRLIAEAIADAAVEYLSRAERARSDGGAAR